MPWYDLFLEEDKKQSFHTLKKEKNREKHGNTLNIIIYIFLGILVLGIISGIILNIVNSSNGTENKSPSSLTLHFLITPIEQPLDGEVYFNKDLYLGKTTNGTVKLNESFFTDQTKFILNSGVLTIKGDYNKKYFEFEFPFQFNEKEYNFTVSKQDFVDYGKKIENQWYYQLPTIFYNITAPLMPENLIWDHLPLTYAFQDCIDWREKKADGFRTAIKLFEKEVNRDVTFKEINDTNISDIIVICNRVPFVSRQVVKTSDYFYDYVEYIDVIGEAKILSSYAKGEYTVLNQTQIIIPGSFEDCSNWAYPLANYTTEIHELLHVLGFGHVYDDTSDIMSPEVTTQLSCSTQIKPTTINAIHIIYNRPFLIRN